eukprot:PhM_4_TR14885/c0_g1_i1/m.106586
MIGIVSHVIIIDLRDYFFDIIIVTISIVTQLCTVVDPLNTWPNGFEVLIKFHQRQSNCFIFCFHFRSTTIMKFIITLWLEMIDMMMVLVKRKTYFVKTDL